MGRMSKRALAVEMELCGNQVFRRWAATRLVQCLDGEIPSDLPSGVSAAVNGRFRATGAGLEVG